MRTVLLSFFVLSCSLLPAQSHKIITGKIIDKTTKAPIGFAHVGIPEQGIGTATNNRGTFTFKVPEYYTNSTLVVSFIGYKTYRMPIQRIKGPLTIPLEQSPTSLQEVVVMDQSAVEHIIRKAIKRIPLNYATYPTSSTGFYRESRTDSFQNFIYLAEGVLEVYKTSYKKSNEGQVRLIQGRQVDLLPPEEMRGKTGFTSGHLSAHRFDVVKNRENFIDERYFPVYKYWVIGITTYNDRPVYIIGFDRDDAAKNSTVNLGRKSNKSGLGRILKLFNNEPELGRARMKGKIYIDTTSYAFLRTEFEIRKEALRRHSDYPLYSGSWKGNRYVVNYRQVGDKWYFGDAFREGKWRDGGIYTNEFMVTEIPPGRASPIPYLERLDRNMAFRRNTGDYDPDFWKHYNTVPMSSDLALSFQQSANQKKAEEVFDSTYMAAMKRQRDSIRLSEMSEEERAQLEKLPFPEPELDNDEKAIYQLPDIQKPDKRSAVRFQFAYGLGANLIRTEAARISMAYGQSEDGQPILSLTEDINTRNFEVFSPLQVGLVIKDRWLLRWGWAPEFWNSIYKENSIGGGVQLNLTKGRPIYLRGLVQYSKFKYARKIGQATNEYGSFKAGKKKFKSDKINLYYGSHTRNVKAGIELALELNRGTELYLRGSYLLPFTQDRRIYLWERDRFLGTRKKTNLPLDANVKLFRNDAPFQGDITDFSPLLISIGIIKK